MRSEWYSIWLILIKFIGFGFVMAWAIPIARVADRLILTKEERL